ncbi:hypothetical protein EBR96_04015, partial [bacterium]|nr:hypothetical protein [bacterium]
MNKTYQLSNDGPTVNITVKKSRMKQYYVSDTPTYYLNNGTEFEIELFNNTNETVLAEIKLNNKIISNGGLVLKPAQRVFLERFLDSEQKFLFETYEVDDTDEINELISNNGDVSISFYKEMKKQTYYKTLPYYDNYYFPTDFNNGFNYKSINTNHTNTNYFVNSLSLTANNTIETGRIEKGTTSNQKFKNVNMEFTSIPFHKYNCKLLPISQKINTIDDINVRRYCTNCGKKLNKTDNFC